MISFCEKPRSRRPARIATLLSITLALTQVAAAEERDRRNLKGMELYSWADEHGTWNYVILPGTNRQKTEAWVKGADGRVGSVEALGKWFLKLAEGEYVAWNPRMNGVSLPDPKTVAEVEALAKNANLELEIFGRKKEEKRLWLTEGVGSARDMKTIKDALLFVNDWKEFEWRKMKILVGLSVLPTFGESHIDIHGYVYNEHFKEWRRFCVMKTRNLGGGDIGLDEEAEELFVVGTANTPMKGKRVFRYDLRMLSNDAGHLPKD